MEWSSGPLKKKENKLMDNKIQTARPIHSPPPSISLVVSHLSSLPKEYEEEEEEYEEEEYGNNEGYRGDDLYIEKAGVGPVVNVLKRGERVFYVPQGYKKQVKIGF
ncbi:hypothetical protein NC651_003886 [Populus alba x Populus x berolinensis]|nr:hypothetical protein NC651_003886 [Populus alba x Populus x berolinensis]